MPSPTPLTQDDLTRWRACPRLYWLQRHSEPSEAALLGQSAATMVMKPDWAHRADRTQTGQTLRATFPEAVHIATPDDEDSWAKAMAQTRACLADGWLAGARQDDGRAILGACLESNEGVRVQIDVLAAGEHGLRLFKVRHATVGTDADVDVVAFWTHVAARCGLRVQSAGLMLIDTDFVYPGMGCYAGLYREVELMPVLGSRPVAQWLVGMRACERGREPPVAESDGCQAPCPFLHHCGIPSRQAEREQAASLNIVGRELAATLREHGHIDVMSVGPDELPDERRRRAVRAVRQGRCIVEPEASALLRALPYPRYTLRMDTIGFAQPIWPGTRPYQIMPFQWTCDVQAAPGQLKQHAFLATEQGDPRRAFAQSLIDVLGSSGPIFAYNAGFERKRIKELASTFEDLAGALHALDPRIVDLFQLARAHAYHPDMCGSWSFKSFVRAFAPQSSADRFDWQGITEAQEAFALSLQGSLNSSALDSLRQALLAYGQRQTEALRLIVHVFENDALA